MGTLEPRNLQEAAEEARAAQFRADELARQRSREIAERAAVVMARRAANS